MVQEQVNNKTLRRESEGATACRPKQGKRTGQEALQQLKESLDQDQAKAMRVAARRVVIVMDPPRTPSLRPSLLVYWFLLFVRSAFATTTTFVECDDDQTAITTRILYKAEPCCGEMAMYRTCGYKLWLDSP